MKRNIAAAAILAALISPGFAVDQWPGQSDFDNLNGRVRQTDDFGQVPVWDYRFKAQKPPRWLMPSTPKSSLTPAQYNQCKQFQYEKPAQDLDCSGPDMPY